MRWVAAILWIVVAAFAFIQFMSDKFATIQDLAPTAVYLAAAILIAVGGRVGRVASTLGVGLAALLTLGALAFERWPFVPVFVVVILVNGLAVREINRTPAQQ
jgi:hypothetical protein